jgi:hypothetical protein
MVRHTLLIAVAVVTMGACGCAPAPPPFNAVADVKQLMESVVEPSADLYWDAVGTIVDAKGSHDFEPQTAEEWEAVRNAAYVVAESGNLLMIGSRVKGGGDWMTMARAMTESGRRAIRAAEERDPAAVFDAGGVMYEACTNCHAKYAPETQRPNAQ